MEIAVPKTRNVNNHKTPTKKPSKSMSISSQRGRISTTMISAPTPNSFVHVAHVGINEKGIIETSKDLDPTWTSLINELQGYGITQSICEEQLDFIEGFLAGAKSVDPKASIPSPKKQENGELNLLPFYLHHQRSLIILHQFPRSEGRSAGSPPRSFSGIVTRPSPVS